LQYTVAMQNFQSTIAKQTFQSTVAKQGLHCMKWSGLQWMHLATEIVPQVMFSNKELTITAHKLSKGECLHSHGVAIILLPPTSTHTMILLAFAQSPCRATTRQYRRTGCTCQQILHLRVHCSEVQTADSAEHFSLADTDKPQVMCTTTVLTLAAQTLSSGGLPHQLHPQLCTADNTLCLQCSNQAVHQDCEPSKHNVTTAQHLSHTQEADIAGCANIYCTRDIQFSRRLLLTRDQDGRSSPRPQSAADPFTSSEPPHRLQHTPSKLVQPHTIVFGQEYGLTADIFHHCKAGLDPAKFSKVLLVSFSNFSRLEFPIFQIKKVTSSQ
jgi:hypothetical protein